MIINLIYDASANNAPASFKAALQQAAAILDAAITNPITVNIEVGYGDWPDRAVVQFPANRLRGGPTMVSSFPLRRLSPI